MTTNPYTLADGELERLLDQDTPSGDATTFALGIGGRAGRMVFRARHAMVVCGSEEACRMGELRGLRAATSPVPSGTGLPPGEVILTLEGPATGLHTVWKTAQTLMEYLSGIATATADLVAAARRASPDIGIACTRKNFPGTKAAAMKAVLCGGAAPHRLGLSETLLVFAEHRAFLDNEPAAATVRRLRRQWPERAVVVEVGDAAEALLWADAGADILQLEKLPPGVVASLRQSLGNRPTRIAAAGGINSANAEDYARAGADILVTSAPYFAPPRDVAVTLSPV